MVNGGVSTANVWFVSRSSNRCWLQTKVTACFPWPKLWKHYIWKCLRHEVLPYVSFHSTASSFKHNLNNLIYFDYIWQNNMCIYIYVCVCVYLATCPCPHCRRDSMLFINKGQHDSYSDVSMVKATPTMILSCINSRYIYRNIYDDMFDMLIQICLFTYVEIYLWMHTFCILPYICLSNNYYPMDESPVIVCVSVVSQPWRTTYHHHWKLMNKLNPVPLLTHQFYIQILPGFAGSTSRPTTSLSSSFCTFSTAPTSIGSGWGGARGRRVFVVEGWWTTNFVVDATCKINKASLATGIPGMAAFRISVLWRRQF